MADPLLNHGVIQRQVTAYAYVTKLKKLCKPQYVYTLTFIVTALMLSELRRNGCDEYTQKKLSRPPLHTTVNCLSRSRYKPNLHRTYFLTELKNQPRFLYHHLGSFSYSPSLPHAGRVTLVAMNILDHSAHWLEHPTGGFQKRPSRTHIIFFLPRLSHSRYPSFLIWIQPFNTCRILIRKFAINKSTYTSLCVVYVSYIKAS